jgi:hypothetical protein
MHRAATLCLALAAALLLAGCAGMRLVDNQVQAFAAWEAGQTPAPGQGFRFERLPSQQGAQAERQSALEAPVLQRLQAWGLRLEADDPRWLVQVSAQTQRHPRAPWDDPWPRFGLSGYGHVVTGSGQIVFVPTLHMRMDLPYYERELVVLVRDARDGRVVYETRAAHDGRWHDSPAIWAAMAEAALRDFPQPPAGPRRVDVEIPR